MMFQLMKVVIIIWETATVVVKLNAEMFLWEKNECITLFLMPQSCLQFIFLGPDWLKAINLFVCTSN